MSDERGTAIEFGVTRRARVFWNNRLKEYRVKLYVNNKYYEPADYFTDDLDDATETAKRMAQGK